MTEHAETIVQNYLDGTITRIEALNGLHRRHQSMREEHGACIIALTDIGIPVEHATTLVQGWEQELNETVQLA